MTMMPVELLAWLTLWLALVEQGSAQTCMRGYEWMNNQKRQSPCVVAGWIIDDSLAGTGANVNPLNAVGAINPSGQYNSPGSSNTVADARTCSWTFYNAMQACAFCQGGRSQSWMAWSSTTCQGAGHVSNDSYWPTGVAVNTNTAFPQYMIYNPSNWLNGMFDVPTAQRIASQNLPDATDTSASQPDPEAGSPIPPPPPNDSHKGPSTGVLAGAIVGGILGLSALAALIWWLACVRPRDKSLRTRRKHVDLDDEKGLPPPTLDGILGAKIEPFSFAPGHDPRGEMQTMPLAQPGMMYQNAPGMSPPAIYSPLSRNSPPPRAGLSPSLTPSPGPQPVMMTTTFVRHSNSSLANQVPNPQIDEKRRIREYRSNSFDSARSSSVPSAVPSAFNIPTHGLTYDNKPSNSSSSSQKADPQHDTSSTKPGKKDKKGKGKLETTLYPTNLGPDVLSDSSHGNDNEAEVSPANEGAVTNTMNSLSAYQPAQWTAANVDAFMSANPGARIATGRDRDQPPPTY